MTLLYYFKTHLISDKHNNHFSAKRKKKSEITPYIYVILRINTSSEGGLLNEQLF